jgi:hypothetical protein
MKNPWTKKNPFMSMWLSGAHKAAGAARSQAAATFAREAARARKSATTAANEQILDFWSAALGGPAGKSRKRRR